MEGSNLKVLIPVALSLVDTDGSIRKYYQELTEKKWSTEPEDNKADASMYLLQHIDKGEFAQALATQLVLSGKVISVPEYIRKTIIWACGGNPDES